MWFTYIIYSRKLKKYYTGYTENLQDRLERHNRKSSKYTSITNDWELKYSESYEDKHSAMKRDLDIKRMKSRKYIEALLASGGGPE